MLKYISPWYLSLLCSICALMHWQQLRAAHCLSPTGAIAVQLTQPTHADISEMEQAALHRMAKSIAQLTLCQVTGKEIEIATKLLEKACQKLRGIPEVPPQRVTDLDNAMRKLHQLSYILDNCIISASYEVSQAQKALLLLPLRKSITPTCRTPLTRMSFMSTRILFDAEDRQSTPERNLSGLWAPLWFLSFHPRSVFTPHFTMSHFYFPFATWQYHYWFLDRIKVSARMLPVGPALCDLETPCWGEPWFPHCALVASPFRDYYMVFLGFCYFVLVFFCHTNSWGDIITSSLLVRFRCLWIVQLITGRAGFWCFCVICLVLGFCCLLFCLARWQLNGLCIDPIQFFFVYILSS